MSRKLLVLIALGCLTIAIAVTAPMVVSRQADNQVVQRTQVAQRTVDGNGMMSGDHMMSNSNMMDGDHMMCGDGAMDGDRMMDGDRITGGNTDMQVVRQLFAYHDQIRRSVEEIPGGVQTLTESDNPEIATLIQQHVASMHQRLEGGRWFAMMSRTLPILFRNADRYQRQSQITPNGIAVTKTSGDAELANVLSEHAQEVTEFVQSGMPQMGCGRMRQQ